MHHHFTVDVEEWFQVHALEPYVSRAQWDRLPSRVEGATRTLLELLAEHGATGTFFTLGWIAERHPRLVRDIAAAGHEVASHGWGHEKVGDLSPARFRESIRASKAILEDAAGTAVLGYRAPSFSITPSRAWAFDLLLEEGYAYDSSVFPGRGHGWPAALRDPHRAECAAGVLHELPPATIRIGGRLFPAGGGAFLRHLPLALVRAGLRQAERRGVPATFYVHPWELDPDQPRLPVDLKTRLRHYGGLARTAPRIRRLLNEFRFQSIARTLSLDPRIAEAPCPA